MSSMRSGGGLRLRGGHVGGSVGALVDGQLDAPTSDRLWAHVARCTDCERAVEAENWVKRRMAGSAGLTAPAGLLGSLRSLPANADRLTHPRVIPGRRRRYLVAGAGSVSAVLVGFAALSGGAPTAGASSGDGTTPVLSPVTAGEDSFLSAVFVTH